MTPRAAREARGLTAKQAAKKAGVTVDYILRVERGYVPSFNLLECLSRLYGCRMEDFLFNRGRRATAEKGRGGAATTPARVGAAEEAAEEAAA